MPNNNSQSFWSSSEYSDYTARSWGMHPSGPMECYWFNKSNGYDVRPVLAF